jgi:hypothetical protein
MGRGLGMKRINLSLQPVSFVGQSLNDRLQFRNIH